MFIVNTADMHKSETIAKSFKYAFEGLRLAVKERNFSAQLTIGICSVALAFILDLSAIERIVVVLLAALVLASEAMNSAVERLLDFVSKEHLEEIREVKDLMASAVLILSIAAFFAGAWIFGNAIF